MKKWISFKQPRQSGFTLVEVILAAGLSTGVLLISFMAAQNVMSWQTKNTYTTSVSSMVSSLGNSFRSQSAWYATITDPANASMACLAAQTDCSASAAGGTFRADDQFGHVIFDPTPTSGGLLSGFGPAGNCVAYDPINGNLQCPFTYTLTWKPLCSPNGPCINPGVQVNAKFLYSMPPSAQNMSFNSANYSIKMSTSPVQTANPIISSTAYYVNQNTPLNVDLLKSAISGGSGNAGTLTVVSFTNGTYGAVANGGGGSVTYTPHANFHGLDSFTYVVKSSNGGLANGTAWVKVMTPFTWTGNAGNFNTNGRGRFGANGKGCGNGFNPKNWRQFNRCNSNAAANWATKGNWCGTVNSTNTGCDGGAAPGKGGLAIFDNTCAGTCDATINTNITIGGLEMDAGYIGTIMQGTASANPFTRKKSGQNQWWDQFEGNNQQGVNVNISGQGFNQVAGTYVGGVGNMAVIGPFLLSGGNFTVPTNMTLMSTMTISNSPVFTATNSTVTFYCYSGATCDNTVTALTPGTALFNNVTFNGWYGSYNLGGNLMTVGGNLLLGNGWGINGGHLDNGTLNVTGDIGTNNYGYLGTAIIVATGNPAGQILSSSIDSKSVAPIENLVISTGGNPVTLNGTVAVTGNFNMISVGAFNTSGSTLMFYCESGWPCDNNTTSIVPGTPTYGNVNFNGWYGTFDLGNHPMTVGGNLTLGNRWGDNGGHLNNGTLNVQGDITTANFSYLGSALVVATGNSSGQTITSGNYPIPNLVINAGANAVTLGGTVKVTGNYTFTSAGGLNTMGSTLMFYCETGWPCDNTTTMINPGTVTYGNVNFNGWYGTYSLNFATLHVGGNLTLGNRWGDNGGKLNSGNINVAGDITTANFGYLGSAIVTAIGNISGQTITSNNYPIQNLTINAGTNPITFSNVVYLTGDYTFVSAGVLTATGSTLVFYCETGWPCDNNTSNITPGTSWTYNNVNFNGWYGTYNLNNGTMNIGGDLTLGNRWGDNGGHLNSGNLNVNGNITTTNFGYLGSATVIAAGGGASGQTITTNSYPVQNLTIAAGTNTVTLNGVVNVTGNYTMTSVGTLVTAGSTLTFYCETGWPCDNTTTTINPGLVNYNNVNFNGWYGTFDLASNTINVNGLLTLGNRWGAGGGNINNGTLKANGTYVFDHFGYLGNATIVTPGHAAQQVTQAY